MIIFNKMKLRVSMSLIALALIFAACEDPDKAPIVTFDSAAHGIYPRTLSQDGELLVNLLSETDFNSSNYSYTVEFVDDNGSQNVAEVYVELTYSPVSGDAVGPLEVTRIPASSLTTSENGFLQTTIEVNSTTLASTLGLNYTDFSAGDEFQLATVIVHNNGTEFRRTNSSSTVSGEAFQGLNSAFTRPLACPSDLTGTYSATTTDVWCNGGSVTSDVTIEALGGGSYVFNDWSLGAYSQCYGAASVASSRGIIFTDVCETVSFTGFTDDFGDTWTFDSSISGEEWTINWTNTYSESGNSVITFPGGVPFTLAD